MTRDDLLPIALVGLFLTGYLSGYVAAVMAERQRRRNCAAFLAAEFGQVTTPPLEEDAEWIDRIEERIVK